MDSQKLKHLLAIVEHGTFSDAARAVHLTQPALSRSIRSLEDELKAQLFDRGARRARLTVFGELVAERARRIRLEMTQLQRDMELLRGAQEGQLNVGFSRGPSCGASMASMDRRRFQKAMAFTPPPLTRG